MMFAVWRGTLDQQRALLRAVDHNCECQRDWRGALLRECAAHRMLTEQKTVDHLLYGRAMIGKWREEEWSAH